MFHEVYHLPPKRLYSARSKKITASPVPPLMSNRPSVLFGTSDNGAAEPASSSTDWQTRLAQLLKITRKKDLRRQIDALNQQLNDLQEQASSAKEQFKTEEQAQQEKIEALKKEVSDLQEHAHSAQEQFRTKEQTQQKKIETLNKQISDLLEHANSFKKQFRTKEQTQEDQAKLKELIAQDLPYDATQPTLLEKIDPLAKKTIIDVQPTSQAPSDSQMTPLVKPTLSEVTALTEKDPPLTLTVPGQPNKEHAPDDSVLIPSNNHELNRLQDTVFTYQFNVNWSLKKCVRDLFQNFSDSHGQTLAGTKIQTTRSHDGTYTVRIKGSAEYDHHYVRNFISSKGEDEDTAGGFGEGTKIMTLSLLKDHAVDAITFSSRNWALEYSGIARSIAGNNTKVMTRKLTQVPDQKGNYLEIKTQKPEVVTEIYNGVDLFYHPGNPDFHAPTYENEVGGFRYLGLDKNGKAKRGNVYPTRQRHEYKVADQWEHGVEFLTLWTKQNVLKNLGTMDRDRLALESGNFSKLSWAIANKMNNQELIQAIFNLQDIWADDTTLDAMGVDRSKLDYSERSDALDYSAGRILLKALLANAQYAHPSIGAHFPKQYLADTKGMSADVILSLKQHGYLLCPSEFADIGMQEAKHKWVELRSHGALKPTKQEIQRINILKKAASILAQYPRVNQNTAGLKLITEEDIQKPIYIFNNTNKSETEDTEAEYGKTQIWYDRKSLEQATFGHALAIYCHEMLHKVGGDGNASFGYALTDVLKGCLDIMPRLKPQDLHQLQDLQSIWNATYSKEPSPINVIA